MLEGWVTEYLASYLGHFCDLQKEQLRVSLWRAWKTGFCLEDVNLRVDAFDYLQLPLKIVQGRIGRLQAQVPWHSLRSSPVVIELSDVHISLRLLNDAELQPGPASERAWAAKQAALVAAELAAGPGPGPGNSNGDAGTGGADSRGLLWGFLQHLITILVNKLRLRMTNVHITLQDEREGTVAGLRLGEAATESSLQRFSLLAGGDPTLAYAPGTLDALGGGRGRRGISKQLALRGLAAYWVAHPPLPASSRFPPHPASSPPHPGVGAVPLLEQAHPLLLPLNCTLQLATEHAVRGDGGLVGEGDSGRGVEEAGLKLLVAAVLQGPEVSLHHNQVASMLRLADRLMWLSAQNKYAALLPEDRRGGRGGSGGWEREWRLAGGRSAGVGAMWRYAVNAVLQDLRGEQDGVAWVDSPTRCWLRRQYIQRYSRHLEARMGDGAPVPRQRGGPPPRSPPPAVRPIPDAEEAAALLEAFERQLSVADIVMCRQVAREVASARLSLAPFPPPPGAPSPDPRRQVTPAKRRRQRRRGSQPSPLPHQPPCNAAEEEDGGAGSALWQAADLNQQGSSSSSAPEGRGEEGAAEQRGYIAWGLTRLGTFLGYMPGREGNTAHPLEPSESDVRQLYEAVDFHPEQEAALKPAQQGVQLALDCFAPSVMLLLREPPLATPNRPPSPSPLPHGAAAAGFSWQEAPAGKGSRIDAGAGDAGVEGGQHGGVQGAQPGAAIASLELTDARLDVHVTTAEVTAGLAVGDVVGHDLVSQGPGVVETLIERLEGRTAAHRHPYQQRPIPVLRLKLNWGLPSPPQPPSPSPPPQHPPANSGTPLPQLPPRDTALPAPHPPTLDVLVQPLRVHYRPTCLLRLLCLLPSVEPGGFYEELLAAVNGLAPAARALEKARYLRGLGPALDVLLKVLDVHVVMGGIGAGPAATPGAVLSTGALTFHSVRPPQPQLSLSEACTLLEGSIRSRRQAALPPRDPSPPADAQRSAAAEVAAVAAIEQHFAYYPCEFAVSSLELVAINLGLDSWGGGSSGRCRAAGGAGVEPPGGMGLGDALVSPSLERRNGDGSGWRRGEAWDQAAREGDTAAPAGLDGAQRRRHVLHPFRLSMSLRMHRIPNDAALTQLYCSLHLDPVNLNLTPSITSLLAALLVPPPGPAPPSQQRPGASIRESSSSSPPKGPIPSPSTPGRGAPREASFPTLSSLGDTAMEASAGQRVDPSRGHPSLSLDLRLASLELAYLVPAGRQERAEAHVHLGLLRAGGSLKVYRQGVEAQVSLHGISFRDLSPDTLTLQPVMGPIPHLAKAASLETLQLRYDGTVLQGAGSTTAVQLQDLRVHGYVGEAGNFIARLHDQHPSSGTLVLQDTPSSMSTTVTLTNVQLGHGFLLRLAALAMLLLPGNQEASSASAGAAAGGDEGDGKGDGPATPPAGMDVHLGLPIPPVEHRPAEGTSGGGVDPCGPEPGSAPDSTVEVTPPVPPSPPGATPSQELPPRGEHMVGPQSDPADLVASSMMAPPGSGSQRGAGRAGRDSGTALEGAGGGDSGGGGAGDAAEKWEREWEGGSWEGEREGEEGRRVSVGLGGGSVHSGEEMASTSRHDGTPAAADAESGPKAGGFKQGTPSHDPSQARAEEGLGTPPPAAPGTGPPPIHVTHREPGSPPAPPPPSPTPGTSGGSKTFLTSVELRRCRVVCKYRSEAPLTSAAAFARAAALGADPTGGSSAEGGGPGALPRTAMLAAARELLEFEEDMLALDVPLLSLSLPPHPPPGLDAEPSDPTQGRCGAGDGCGDSASTSSSSSRAQGGEGLAEEVSLSEPPPDPGQGAATPFWRVNVLPGPDPYRGSTSASPKSSPASWEEEGAGSTAGSWPGRCAAYKEAPTHSVLSASRLCLSIATVGYPGSSMLPLLGLPSVQLLTWHRTPPHEPDAAPPPGSATGAAGRGRGATLSSGTAGAAGPPSRCAMLCYALRMDSLDLGLHPSHLLVASLLLQQLQQEMTLLQGEAPDASNTEEESMLSSTSGPPTLPPDPDPQRGTAWSGAPPDTLPASGSAAPPSSSPPSPWALEASLGLLGVSVLGKSPAATCLKLEWRELACTLSSPATGPQAERPRPAAEAEQLEVPQPGDGGGEGRGGEGGGSGISFPTPWVEGRCRSMMALEGRVQWAEAAVYVLLPAAGSDHASGLVTPFASGGGLVRSVAGSGRLDLGSSDALGHWSMGGTAPGAELAAARKVPQGLSRLGSAMGPPLGSPEEEGGVFYEARSRQLSRTLGSSGISRYYSAAGSDWEDADSDGAEGASFPGTAPWQSCPLPLSITHPDTIALPLVLLYGMPAPGPSTDQPLSTSREGAFPTHQAPRPAESRAAEEVEDQFEQDVLRGVEGGASKGAGARGEAGSAWPPVVVGICRRRRPTVDGCAMQRVLCRESSQSPWGYLCGQQLEWEVRVGGVGLQAHMQGWVEALPCMHAYLAPGQHLLAAAGQLTPAKHSTPKQLPPPQQHHQPGVGRGAGAGAHAAKQPLAPPAQSTLRNPLSPLPAIQPSSPQQGGRGAWESPVASSTPGEASPLAVQQDDVAQQAQQPPQQGEDKVASMEDGGGLAAVVLGLRLELERVVVGVVADVAAEQAQPNGHPAEHAERDTEGAVLMISLTTALSAGVATSTSGGLVLGGEVPMALLTPGLLRCADVPAQRRLCMLPLDDCLLGLRRLALGVVVQERPPPPSHPGVLPSAVPAEAACHALPHHSVCTDVDHVSVWATQRNLSMVAAAAQHTQQLALQLAPVEVALLDKEKNSSQVPAGPGSLFTLKLNLHCLALQLSVAQRAQRAPSGLATVTPSQAPLPPKAPQAQHPSAAWSTLPLPPLPLLQVVASALSLDMHDVGRGWVEASVDSHLRAEVFSSRKQGWEPVVEPWQCRLEALAPTSSTAHHHSLRLSSRHPLELTLTDTAAGAAGLLAEAFRCVPEAYLRPHSARSALAHAGPAAATPALSVAQWVRNLTGGEVEVWLCTAGEVPGAGPPTVRVLPGAQSPLLLPPPLASSPGWHSRAGVPCELLGIALAASNPVGGSRPQGGSRGWGQPPQPPPHRTLLYFKLLGVQGTTWGPVHLDRLEPAVRDVPALQPPPPHHRLVCEVCEGRYGGCTVTLHSGVQVHNRTEASLEVGVQTPMGLVMEPQPLGCIPPRASLWLPVPKAEAGLLCIRPSAGAAGTAGTPPRPTATGGGTAPQAHAQAPLARPSSSGVLYAPGYLSPSRTSLDRPPLPHRNSVAPPSDPAASAVGAAGGTSPRSSSDAERGLAGGPHAAPCYEWSTAVSLQQLLRRTGGGGGGGAGRAGAPLSSPEVQPPPQLLACHPGPGAGEEEAPQLFSMGVAPSDGAGLVCGLHVSAPLVLHNALPVPVDLTLVSWRQAHHVHLRPNQQKGLHDLDAAHLSTLSFQAAGYCATPAIAPHPIHVVTLVGQEGVGQEVHAPDTLVTLEELGHAHSQVEVALEHCLNTETGSHTLRLSCTLWVYNLTGLPISLRQSVEEVHRRKEGDGMAEDEVPASWVPPLELTRQPVPRPRGQHPPPSSASSASGLHTPPNPRIASPLRQAPGLATLSVHSMHAAPTLLGTASSSAAADRGGALSSAPSPGRLTDSRAASTADMLGLGELLAEDGGEARRLPGRNPAPAASRGIADSMETTPVLEIPSRWPSMCGGVLHHCHRLNLQVRATQCKAPEGKSFWSEPVELDAGVGGAAVVTAPAPLLTPATAMPPSKTAFPLSVTAAEVPGSKGALALYILPRYLLHNGLDTPIQYKQQGTGYERELAAGASRPLRCVDASRALRLCVRVQEAGWLWSGGFGVDTPGDLFIKIRHRDRGVTMLVRVDVAASPSGVLVISLSHHPSGFAPYRVDNCSLLTLHARQDRCKEQQDVLRPYCSLNYAWDEPALPHCLVLELPGGRRLGRFSLDKVGQDVQLRVRVKREEPEWRVQVLIRAEGPTRVLAVVDLDRHTLADQLPPPVGAPLPLPLGPHTTQSAKGGTALRAWGESGSGGGAAGSGTGAGVPLEDGRVGGGEGSSRGAHSGLGWEVCAELASLGLSLVGPCQEVCYLRAGQLRGALGVSSARLAADLEVKTLQVDNPSQWVMHPVTLMLPAPANRLLSSTMAAAKLEGQRRPAISLHLAVWQRRPAGVLCIERADVQVAPIGLYVEQEHAVQLASLVASLGRSFLPASNPPQPGHAPQYAQRARSAPALGHLSSVPNGGGRVSRAASAAGEGTSRGGPLPPTTVGVEDSQLGLELPGYLLGLLEGGGHSGVPQGVKVYIDVMRVGGLDLTLSFLPGPWGSDTGGAGRYSAVQRLVSLAEVEDAHLRLAGLEMRHPLMSVSALAQHLQQHYVKAALPEMYKVVGAANVFGDPVRLVHHLGLGVWSFLASPAAGLVESARQRGPRQFVAGVVSGTQQLVANVVFAFSNAATKSSGAARKIIVMLGLDRYNHNWATATFRQRIRFSAAPDPLALTPLGPARRRGRAGGGDGVLEAVLRGVVGVISEPIRGVDEGGLSGLLLGVKRGVLGFVVLPLASLLEMSARMADSVRRAVAGGSSLAWVRPPRYTPPGDPLPPYDWHQAMGRWLLGELDRMQQGASGPPAEPAAAAPSLQASFVLCVPAVTRGHYLIATWDKVLYIQAREPMWTPWVKWSADLGDMELAARRGSGLSLVAQQPERVQLLRSVWEQLSEVRERARGPWSMLGVECEGQEGAARFEEYVAGVIRGGGRRRMVLLGCAQVLTLR